MKTAMTQFLEWLENSSDVQNDILDWETVKENALEKEKEQMINEWKKGFDDAKYIYTPPTLHQNNQTYDGVNLHRFIKDEFDQTITELSNRLIKLESK
jgi:hypothetical protein